MRRRFGKIINKLAKKDDKIVLLVGDIGYGIFDEFRKNHPKKFFNMGICEQSLIGVASGMALEGLKPWVYTITPFLIERPFEQLKLDIDQQNVNVKLVGFSDYPSLGPSHSVLDEKKIPEGEMELMFYNALDFLGVVNSISWILLIVGLVFLVKGVLSFINASYTGYLVSDLARKLKEQTYDAYKGLNYCYFIKRNTGVDSKPTKKFLGCV